MNLKRLLCTMAIGMLLLSLLWVISPEAREANTVWAQEHTDEATEGATPTTTQSAEARAKFLIVSALSAALAISLAGIGASHAQGNAVKSAMDAIGRNPEAQSKVFPILILGLAFIESIALYALLISLALLFFNPLLPKL